MTSKTIGSNELKQFLTRGWMTHDGMWFMNGCKEIGVEQTNRLNLAAIRSMAPIEVARLKKLLEMPEVTHFSQIQAFCEGAMAVIVGDFMDLEWSWQPETRTVSIRMNRCFAHDGVKRLGVIAQYSCGIYERIIAWLDVLEIEHELVPSTPECILFTQGECLRTIHFPRA